MMAPGAAALLIGCVVVSSPPARRSVAGAHGPIALVDSMFADWSDPKSDSLTQGAWYPERREIALDKRLTWTQRPLVLGHERCHAAITDARIALPDSVEEPLCDAIAAGFR